MTYAINVNLANLMIRVFVKSSLLHNTITPNVTPMSCIDERANGSSYACSVPLFRLVAIEDAMAPTSSSSAYSLSSSSSYSLSSSSSYSSYSVSCSPSDDCSRNPSSSSSSESVSPLSLSSSSFSSSSSLLSSSSSSDTSSLSESVTSSSSYSSSSSVPPPRIESIIPFNEDDLLVRIRFIYGKGDDDESNDEDVGRSNADRFIRPAILVSRRRLLDRHESPQKGADTSQVKSSTSAVVSVAIESFVDTVALC
mmetsp:Transcript_30434/g.36166  ORF Transcript_30434/g.36166 Transcript_30434/m.36166 type:complete len:253 (+) Transcript_30434:605-1363(+)